MSPGTRAPRRVAAVLAAVSLTVAACGAGADPDPESSATPTASRSTQDDVTERDLRAALIRPGDIPPTHGTDFDVFALDEDRPSGDDVVSGPSACADYLDDEVGADALHEVVSAYGDPVTTVTVTSVVQHFGQGDAAEVLATVRDLVETCDRFEIELDGAVVEVDAYLADLAEMDAYEDVGDEGLLVGLLVIIDGVPIRGTATTMVRVGDAVGTIGVEVPANFGRDPSPEMTTLMDQRLRELMEDAS